MGCVTSNKPKSIIPELGKPVSKSSDPIQQYLESNEAHLPKRMKELFQNYLANETSHVISVDLRFINLSGVHIKPLLFILPHLPQIRELILWKTSLNNEGCIAICQLMENLPNLSYLSLADNNISYPGVRALTHHFAYTHRLERLELHVNQFGTEACYALAANFGKLQELKTITFDECEMSGEGLAEILKALPSIKKLERVSMDYNYFGDESSNLLVGVINQLERLKRMSLVNTGVNVVTQDALKVIYPDILFSFN